MGSVCSRGKSLRELNERGNRGMTPGFFAAAAEWMVVPFPEHKGAGASFQGNLQTRAHFWN